MSYRKALRYQDSGVNVLNLITACLLLASLLALPGGAVADQSLNSDIERQVESTIRQHYVTRVPESRVNVTVNPINRTLSLTPCNHPLQIELPFSSGERVTARVSCTAPRAWSLFVTARVQQFVTVVTASRPINRNTRIGSNALTLREQDINQLRGDYYTRLQDVAGQTARVPIANGEVISPRQLEASVAVRRGDVVTLEVRKGNLLIRTKGIALEDGRLNEQIDVENQRSGRQLRGIVTAPGVVTMP
jgi:flagella basal body P-ring formation protein FlgA